MLTVWLAPTWRAAGQRVLQGGRRAPLRRHTGTVAAQGVPTAQIVAAVQRRTTEIVDALRALDADGLATPSLLPDWTVLTIACHLRYGATALARMTTDTLAGRPTSYYPGGRAAQRPHTLAPDSGEAPGSVVTSLADRSAALGTLWGARADSEWARMLSEPADNADLGPIELGRLPSLRLTEVEVHGSDLGLGLRDWSDTFVRASLPMRIAWLNVRRANHRAFDADLEGSWLLAASDGPAYAVAVQGPAVQAGAAERSTVATATIEGTSRDLLALLLGRPARHELHVRGDQAFGERFARAFPGP